MSSSAASLLLATQRYSQHHTAPGRGLLRDCKTLRNLREPSFAALLPGHGPVHRQSGPVSQIKEAPRDQHPHAAGSKEYRVTYSYICFPWEQEKLFIICVPDIAYLKCFSPVSPLDTNKTERTDARCPVSRWSSLDYRYPNIYGDTRCGLERGVNLEPSYHHDGRREDTHQTQAAIAHSTPAFNKQKYLLQEGNVCWLANIFPQLKFKSKLEFIEALYMYICYLCTIYIST